MKIYFFEFWKICEASVSGNFTKTIRENYFFKRFKTAEFRFAENFGINCGYCIRDFYCCYIF